MIFRRYLREVEGRLKVPYPARHDLLVEIANHLESLYKSNLSEGAEPETARDEAIRRLALDDELISSMDAVHAPAIQKALAWLPAPVSLVLEHVGIGLLAACALVSVILREEAMLKFLLSGGYFMIPLNLMGLAILVLGGERIFSLYIKRDHSPGNLHKRLLSLRFMAQACALVGIIGTLMGFFEAFSVSQQLEAKFGVFPIWDVSRVAITTTIWGMTLALLALLTSYVIRAKVSRIEELSLGDTRALP